MQSRSKAREIILILQLSFLLKKQLPVLCKMDVCTRRVGRTGASADRGLEDQCVSATCCLSVSKGEPIRCTACPLLLSHRVGLSACVCYPSTLHASQGHPRDGWSVNIIFVLLVNYYTAETMNKNNSSFIFLGQ